MINFDGRSKFSATVQRLKAACHPERSEGSLYRYKILRCAQDDKSEIAALCTRNDIKDASRNNRQHIA
jgi:hypothetical protein